MVAPVASKIRKLSRPGMATSAKSHRSGDWRAAVSRAPDCRRVEPRVGDSAAPQGGWGMRGGACRSRRARCKGLA
jgi:hypothetical protein